MWGLLLDYISKALDLDKSAPTHMSSLQDYCKQHEPDMNMAFKQLIGPQEIQSFVHARFSYVYNHQFPKAEK